MNIAKVRNSKFCILQPAICSGNGGFTLLELVIAIFILSLVLALSLPSLSSLGESRIKSDAKKLASLLRHLNDSAITTKEGLFIKVDLKDKVAQYRDPDGERSVRFDSISSVELQTRGMISEGEVTVFFGPTGAAESFQFHLRDDTRGLVVALNALSGRVKITDEVQIAK